jgi:hypothetical protein
MKIPPFDGLEISLPGPEDLNKQDESNNASNHDSIGSELSLDLLTKEHDGGSIDDSKEGLSSSGSCRWNPDDSDYSLNVLLPPQREESPERYNGDDSVSAATKESLLGSDYSLNKIRASVKKSGKMLDASSCHSTLSVDTFDTDFSITARSKLPENIEVKKPGALKRQTTVSFYPRVRIQRVPPRKSISKEQTEAVWYSRDEFHVIRKECFRTIKLMSDDDNETDEAHPLFDEDENELCRRGLEYKTPLAYKKRQKQKKDMRNVIFEEQDYQEDQGLNDPEWLANLSRDQSRSCVAAAIEVAREDERQARLYLGC